MINELFKKIKEYIYNRLIRILCVALIWVKVLISILLTIKIYLV